ncbi:hypothetical protein GCM10022380_54560 [Amycolatopsis tucumanensis]|uniref:IrrE N-terminal-like domain-containing protein n=1 Tax=Amycolatopsis tucumanensis TaxID=401106 RepID=A0ABP7IWW0_9PSEU
MSETARLLVQTGAEIVRTASAMRRTSDDTSEHAQRRHGRTQVWMRTCDDDAMMFRRRLTSAHVHEAGHVVAHLALDIPFEFVQAGRDEGYVRRRRDHGADPLDTIRAYLAGPIAESLCSGFDDLEDCIRIYGRHDIKQAAEIHRELGGGPIPHVFHETVKLVTSRAAELLTIAEALRDHPHGLTYEQITKLARPLPKRWTWFRG